MNKRIKELALKAGFKNYDGTSLYSPYIEGMELNDELREFAELIIQECCGIVLKNTNLHTYHRVKYEIRNHFGVE